jgi:hypothetical protein
LPEPCRTTELAVDALVWEFVEHPNLHRVEESLRARLYGIRASQPIWRRENRGADLRKLGHHSYRGVQYRAIRYTQRLAEAGAVASVGSKGDSFDCETLGRRQAA